MSSESNDSNKPSLPLEEIQSFDASKLHHQNEVVDKTGVHDHDKMLSAVEGGKLNEHLKHVDENDAKVKQWKPTQEDIEEDAKAEQQSGGAPKA